MAAVEQRRERLRESAASISPPTWRAPTHFGGPANKDANGNYYVMDMSGATWGDTLDADGYTWSRGYTWSQGYTWSEGYTWSRGLHLVRATPGAGLYLVARLHLEQGLYLEPQRCRGGTRRRRALPATTPASIASWVPNE